MDTTTKYVTILPLIQQATMLLHYSWSNNLLPYHTPWYSKLLRYHTPIDTANHYITIPNWYSYYIITISLCNNNLLRYYIPIIIYYKLLCSYTARYNKLLCYYATINTTILSYYTLIDTANHYLNILLLTQPSTTLLHS